MCYLAKFDDVIITSANLYKPVHDIINYSVSICPSEPEKCGKEGKKSHTCEEGGADL